MDGTFPDEDILRMIIDYLDPIDCMSLLSAAIWPLTAVIVKEKRQLKLGDCYGLTPSVLLSFVRNCILPERIRHFDASHCHWIASVPLVEAVCSMKGLQELYIEDTQLTLIHLTPIFLACPKVTHLSISLRDVYQVRANGDHVASYRIEDCLFVKQNFKKLTHVKLAWSEMFSSWPVVFEILGWCHDCRSLYLEQHFHHERFSHPDLEDIRSEQFPKLQWMENLASIVYQQKGMSHVADPIFQALCQWIFTKLKLKNIKQLWLPADECQVEIPPRNIESWHVGSLTIPYQLDCFTHLREIGGAELDQLPLLPRLRFADGNFSTYRGLFEFIQRQPMLEYLSAKASIMQEFDYIGDFKLPPKFKLNRLRKLIYSCCILDPAVLGKLVQLLPNLEEISLNSEEPFDFFEPFNLSASFLDQISRLKRLRKLSIEGQVCGSVSVFEKIFVGCDRLETLNLSGKHLDDDVGFLRTLSAALPSASNLRELRLKWQHVTEFGQFEEILKSVGRCCQLRILHIDCWGMVGDNLTTLPQLIVDTVIQLSHLNSLSLQLKLNEWILEKAREQIDKIILPHRPSFWFSNGLPMGDPILSITCLHCYEFGYDSNESPCGFLRRIN